MADQKGARARFVSGRWEQLRSWELAPLVPFYVLLYSGKELLRNRGTILAASLAFVTALSLVPLLSVTVSVLAALNILERDASDLEPYLQRLFPASASEIATYLQGFAASSASEVAGIGAISFFVIGLFLFIAIERGFNIMWSTERERPWLQKSFAFVSLMTFGPMLLSVSFTMSARAQFRLSQFGVDTSAVEQLLPFLLGFVLFTAMNYFLPTSRVRWWAALLAGAFTATSFELAKWGFSVYVTEIILVPYNQIYGALGLFPLFLVWLYIIWIVVLSGAELAYCAQNLRTLVTIDSVQQMSGGRHAEHVFNPLVALELYAPIARAFKSGEGRVSEKDLLTRTGYSEAVIRAVVTQLESLGALDVVEDDLGERRLLPAKQLDDIALLPIVESFFDFDQKPNSLTMAHLLSGYREVTLATLRSENALSLIAPATDQANGSATARPADSAARPPVDDDLLESPPVGFDAQVKPREDRSTLPSPIHALKALAPTLGLDEVPPPALDGAARAADSGDGIRIDTQDILVEESDPPRAVKSAETPSESARKEPSIEIDMGGMWDAFEGDNYEAVLNSTSDELRRTEELDAHEVLELGAEASVPPPMPQIKSD